MVISKNLKQLAVFTKNEEWIDDFMVNQLNFHNFENLDYTPNPGL
jgi:hypothetical protein